MYGIIFACIYQKIINLLSIQKQHKSTITRITNKPAIMISLSRLVTRILTGYVLFLFILPAGFSQTQENYFESVKRSENYYDQHPELTDPPSHEFKGYLRWRLFWDSRSQCMDTNYSGKQRLISAILDQYSSHLDYHQRSTVVTSNWQPVIILKEIHLKQ